jgi:hypothetical protein
MADEFENTEYINDIKSYQKVKLEIEQKTPKLFAMILKYLSNESLKVVQRSEKLSEIKAGIDPERLWKAVEDKHRVHSTSQVAGIIKLEARNHLQKLNKAVSKASFSIDSTTIMHQKLTMIKEIQ